MDVFDSERQEVDIGLFTWNGKVCGSSYKKRRLDRRSSLPDSDLTKKPRLDRLSSLPDSDLTKKPKLDRLSSLPDSVIDHILSFLPTKDAIRTGVLSKRWKYLWTFVQNLTFSYHGRRLRPFGKFVDKALTLHSSAKVKKFLLDFSYKYVSRFPSSKLDTCISLWLRFAINRNVEELGLEFCTENVDIPLDVNDGYESYEIPQFVYECSTLTKLSSRLCDFVPKRQVLWGSLKVLTIGFAELRNDVLQSILLGSPVLEYLELNMCRGLQHLDVGSSGLKKLVVRDIWDPTFTDDSIVEISGPNLKSLEILGRWYWKKCRLLDVSALVDAILNFELAGPLEHSENSCEGYLDMMVQLLEKLNHVRQLSLGTWIIQVMSAMEVNALPSPLSYCKCLILDTLFNKWILPGIASLLHISPILERLVIDMTDPGFGEFDFVRDFLAGLDEKNYWNSANRSFNCLLKHLKTIEILGLERFDPGHDLALAFLQFVLQNATVLERTVVTPKNYGDSLDYLRICNLYELAQKLLSFPISSPKATFLLPK